MRVTPRPRNIGSNTRWPASLSREYCGPASYNKRWFWVRTRTAVPWPTSSASSSKLPASTGSGWGISKGNVSGKASSRARQGTGMISNAAPDKAAIWAQAGAAGKDHTAPGSAARPLNALIRPEVNVAANAQSGAAKTPSKASGVMSSVTTGIASRLASRPTNETCWKNTRLSGVRPRVATTCVRKPPRSTRTKRAIAPLNAELRGTAMPGACTGRDAINSATAPNDSQNPGCSRAQGSMSETTHAAASSTKVQGHANPNACKPVTAASIQTVRCAGTPQPESSA